MAEKTLTIKKDMVWKIGTILFAVLFIISLVWNPFGRGTGEVITEDTTGEPEKLAGSSFFITGDPVCKDADGKPYVILFSTTWCGHCIWIKDTFESLANEDFADKINLQHWEIDIGDNTLTSEIETEAPAEINALYQRYNPRGSIPTFVFGCEYFRVGNGYESQGDLNAELEDFKLVINKLLE
jgi:thiol-disulfide isomerase/thioredoxin